MSVEGNFGESCARSFAGSVVCEGVCVDEAFCSNGRDNFASAECLEWKGCGVLRESEALLLPEEDDDSGAVVVAGEGFSSVLFFNERKNLWRNSNGLEGCDCAEDDGSVFFSFTLVVPMLLCGARKVGGEQRRVKTLCIYVRRMIEPLHGT